MKPARKKKKKKKTKRGQKPSPSQPTPEEALSAKPKPEPQTQPETTTAVEEKPEPEASTEESKGDAKPSKDSYFAAEKFESLELSSNTQKALQEAGFTKMTHIQAKSIPVLLQVNSVA